MANYTAGDTRVPADFTTYQNNGSAVLDSRRTRPKWFDGRFLAGRDLDREQNYYLQREADLGRAPGFGVIQGLSVNTVTSTGQTKDAQTIVIGSGQGVTPAGELVRVPSNLTLRISDLVEQASLSAQFGLASAAVENTAARTGLYVIALQPVQFTANAITAYPLTVNGTKTMVNGDVVEATAVLLVPYPGPANTNDSTTLHAALARQIFVTGNPGVLSESLLPLTMISMQNGVIEWIDPWLVRREAAVAYTGVRFGLTDPAVQQSFLLQYDTQLQQTVNTFVRQNLPARFAASSFAQALPPSGRFPIASISTDGFTQIYFPPQIDVRLSVVPEDEIPALIEDSLALPPIDLMADPSSYADLAIFALIPVLRQGFAALATKLPQVAVNNILPQVLNNRRPIELLRFYQGNALINQPSGADNSAWQTAIANQTYGYYIRRRSSPPVVHLNTPPPPTTTTTATTTPTTPKPPTTTTTTTTPPQPTTTTTTPAPTTTTPAPTTTITTTTPKPTTTTTTTTTTTPRPPSTTTLPITTTTRRIIPIPNPVLGT